MWAGMYCLESYQVQCDILHGILTTVLEPVEQFFISLCFLLPVFHVAWLGLGILGEKCNVDQ